MRVPRGKVDGVNGCCVVGWAIAAADGEHCRIRVLDEAGQEIASGLADNPRLDLASLDVGRTDLSFRLPVPDFETPTLLYVHADDLEISGSPVIVGRGQFDGDFTVSRGLVSGWVTERYNHFQAPEVRLTTNDGVIVSVMQSHSAQSPSDPTFNPAYFHGTLDQCCYGTPDLKLHAAVNGQLFAHLSCHLVLQGYLDCITHARCAGWLLAPDTPGRQFEVEIFRNGVLAVRTMTTIARSDVREQYQDAVSPGFDVTLPSDDAIDMEPATILIRLAGSEIDLFGGPQIVSSPAAVVRSAQRVARATLRLDAEIGPTERAVTRLALAEFIAQHRRGNGLTVTPKPIYAPLSRGASCRLTIIIPCYRGVEVTRQCIASVLAHGMTAADQLILVNDASPDPGLAPMLEEFNGSPNLKLLTNAANMGFIRSVNRALDLCWGDDCDVILLNSDTEIFAGAFDELYRVAHSRPGIGTVTPLSNVATIFSYPHERRQCQSLDDITWHRLAELALEVNRDVTIEVPTGHGFCLFIRGDTLRETGLLDQEYGRGYGEENDFCARASDLGYLHLAAASVFVRHLDGVSFGSDKTELVRTNLARLSASYPEYPKVIAAFVRGEGLRRARWALDAARLGAMVAAGESFVLLVVHKLGGGTAQALRDIETAVGYEGAIKLTLCCLDDGSVEIQCENPAVLAVFAPDECNDLFDLLTRAAVRRIFVHQLLGFRAAFIEKLAEWIGSRESTFYTHDFYALCPRVTMINAVGAFCDIAPPEVCLRCVKRGGSHDASRTSELSPARHRALFGHLLSQFRHVVAPSDSAKDYFRRQFPELAVETLPHPERLLGALTRGRRASDDEIVLVGAIGPHKGSALLLDLANRAVLTAPHLRFKVIGYTNIDQALLEIGNVVITGPYDRDQLPGLLTAARGRVALFLHRWPETYSYTLSEVLNYGFIPVVPDIGAPAERLKALRCGVIYPFSTDTESLLRLIEDVVSNSHMSNETIFERTSDSETAFSLVTADVSSTKIDRAQSVHVATRTNSS